MKHFIHSQIIKGKVNDIIISEPIILVDNEKRKRSGHVGHAMTEFLKGKIMVFNSNTSFDRFCGHTNYGWVEYRTSEDYGKSFGRAKVFPYSREMFFNGINSVAVEKAITCDNGVIAVFATLCSLFSENCFEPHGKPQVVLSCDGGNTWGKPIEVSSYRGRIFDVLYHKGVCYVLQSCNDCDVSFFANKPEHVYRLFKSTDNCKTFEEVSVVGFLELMGRAYGNMIFTPDEKLIVYTYNVNDEQNMDYCISEDYGLTWTERGKCFVKNKIRNPQIGLLDGQYILHGRAGESEAGNGAFVIYTSADGLKWDDGKVLVKGRPACYYSENLTVRMPNGKERMYIKYSENIADPCDNIWSGRVNGMLCYLETLGFRESR